MSYASRLEPARKVIPMTKGGGALAEPARGIWCGTAGSINFVDGSGATRTAFPVFAGPNAVHIKELNAGGDADNLWAMY